MQPTLIILIQKLLFCIKTGDYDSSVAILEKIVDQAPKDVTILRHLAKALNKQGEKQRANATIQRAIQFAIPTHEKQKLQRIAQQWNKK